RLRMIILIQPGNPLWQVWHFSDYRLVLDWIGELVQASQSNGTAAQRGIVWQSRDSNVRMLIGAVSHNGSGATLVACGTLRRKAHVAEKPCGPARVRPATGSPAQTTVASTGTA